MKVNPNLLYDSGTGYIKFEDGTMICYGEESGSGTRYDYWSNFDRISPTGFEFPKAFLSAPQIVLSPQQQASISGYAENISVSGFDATIFKPKGTNNNNYKFRYIAIGKWK